MYALAVVIGIALVGLAFVDLLNTLVSTSTSQARWWPTFIVGRTWYALVRSVARRLPEFGRPRERLLGAFAPITLLLLLTMWAFLQVFGFGLIWWGVRGVTGVRSVIDYVYYSGVVFFTVGFGEVLPAGIVPRAGAIVEAFMGVVTVALAIGYLPSLYGAYSDRERMLMTIDDGSEDRITPTNLVMAWAPSAHPDDLNERFVGWEQWATGILETHTSLPLLRYFRSHDQRQNWVTALGLLSDAAIHAQIIVGSTGATSSWWFLRRSIAIFEAMTEGADLTAYKVYGASAGTQNRSSDQVDLFRDLYERLEAHGFELVPFDEANRLATSVRALWAPQMEFLIDTLLAPWGFWSPSLGLPLADSAASS